MYALTRGTRIHPLADADRLFEQFFGHGEGAVNGTEYAVALDISEDEDGYEIRAEMPGVAPSDVDLSLVQDVLTVRGEKKLEETAKGARVHRKERRHGKFVRTVEFPMAVDTEKVTAAHRNGVLTIRVPKAAKAKPRSIKIEVAE